MYLVDVDNGLALFLRSKHDALQPLFKFAAVLGSGYDTAEVKLIDAVALQLFRHTAFLYSFRQTIDEGSLSHTRFAYMQRIVLLLAAQNADSLFQFLLPPDKRIVAVQIIVYAGYEVFPGLVLLVAVFMLFVIVVVAVFINQHTCKLGHIVFQSTLQDIGRP